jgi:peptidase E
VADDRQIFAFSGVLRGGPDGPDSLSLVDYAIGLARGAEPPRRVCYVPTGVGDSAEAVDFYLQVFAGRADVDLNVLKLFTQPSVPDVRAHLLDQDVILVEGGSLCWHRGGPTDSFGDQLAPFTDGLGLVPFSNGVHDDFADQPRRRIYRDLIASGALAGGYATEDGVGLHYVGTALHEGVSVVAGKRAWPCHPAAAVTPAR